MVRGFTTSSETSYAATDGPSGPVTVTGVLQPNQGTGEMDDDRSDDVLPQLRSADLVQQVDTDLYGGYVVLDPARSTGVAAATAGLAPATPDQLPDAGRSTALRNILYALEWWFFAAFVLVVWVRWLRDTVRGDRRGAGEREAGAEARTSTVDA